MSFTDEEVDRYARQLVLREIGGQGQQALKAAGEPLAGRLLIYDSLTAEVRTVRVAPDPACGACGGARR